MYASFRSVTAKNGKILTPIRTGNFLLTSNGLGILWEFYATDIICDLLLNKRTVTWNLFVKYIHSYTQLITSSVLN